MELSRTPYSIVSVALFSQLKSWGIGQFTLGNTFFKLKTQTGKCISGTGNTFLKSAFSFPDTGNTFLKSVFSFPDTGITFLKSVFSFPDTGITFSGTGNPFPGTAFSLSGAKKPISGIGNSLNDSGKSFSITDFLFFDFRNMANGYSFIEFKTYDKSQGKYIFNNKI